MTRGRKGAIALCRREPRRSLRRRGFRPCQIRHRPAIAVLLAPLTSSPPLLWCSHRRFCPCHHHHRWKKERELTSETGETWFELLLPPSGKPPGRTEERRHNHAQPPLFLPPRNPAVPLVAGKRCGCCGRSPPELLLHSADPSELLAAAGAVARPARNRSYFVLLVHVAMVIAKVAGS
ncbi:uncharacterized protein DS421_15g510600 [Arachis hypogaea]|nr:uncharacterized protein DS421_15g510600 [Arachis hypogaea]